MSLEKVSDQLCSYSWINNYVSATSNGTIFVNFQKNGRLSYGTTGGNHMGSQYTLVDPTHMKTSRGMSTMMLPPPNVRVCLFLFVTFHFSLVIILTLSFLLFFFPSFDSLVSVSVFVSVSVSVYIFE